LRFALKLYYSAPFPSFTADHVQAVAHVAEYSTDNGSIQIYFKEDVSWY